MLQAGWQVRRHSGQEVLIHVEVCQLESLLLGERKRNTFVADILSLSYVAELDGGAVEDAAEGDGLDFPVRHGVAEQADAGVHGLLVVEAGRTEVLSSHGRNLVGMEVDHLEKGI
ncbi:hypothetical protein EYF80_033532 [Liparis tanakae]|uniref:Uncharacterized protein n=1 Tax=Liparis tanakae TaxID=230148 RepID=A0A4Z2GS79_9TELE|nr:hypothetical protein EYF80_033532 [Liparis tanakae]